MKKKPPIIFIIVAAVVVVAAVVFIIVNPFGDSEPEIVYTPYSAGEAFITNIWDSNQWLKINIVLILDTNKLAETLDANSHKIRDTIGFILRDLTVDEIKSREIKEILRERICARLNERFEITNFVDIDITDFVLQ